MSAEPKTVLVVDDEPLFVRSLADGLRPLGERDGFVVLTATNGRDAVAALQSEQVDLVLTDLRMPGMDGFQLISWMIAQKRNVPVVVMTAMPSLEARVQLRQTGAFTVLQKPVDLAEVHKCIVSELGARRVRVEGLATSAFLQLVSMERVSCVLTIRSGTRVGHMGIVGGDLVHAELEDRDGLAAAHALVGLPDAVIEMVEREDVPKSGIVVPLAEVVLDALRSHDEQARGEGRITAPPSAPGEIDLEFDLLKSKRPPPLEVETTPPPALVAVLASAKAPVIDTPSSGPRSTPQAGTPKSEWPSVALPAPEVAASDTNDSRGAPTSAPLPLPLRPAPISAAPPPPLPTNEDPRMNVISVEKVNVAVTKLRESLGAGLVSTDVWNVDDGMPIAGFNSQPVATALFNRITDVISDTLAESGFPALNKYYLLDLEGDKIVVVIPLGKYRAGMLVDKKKAQLGVVVSVALPKYVNGLEEAIRG